MPEVSPSENSFATEKVAKILSGWWDLRTQSPLKAAPKPGMKGTVFALQPELSSQQAVGVLVSCKNVLGYRPSKNTIQKGGYTNKAEFVTTLLQAMEKEHASKQPIPQTQQSHEGVPSDAAATL